MARTTKPGTVRLDRTWSPTWHQPGSISESRMCCWGHDNEVPRPLARWTTVIDYDDGGQTAYGLCDTCHEQVLSLYRSRAS